MRFRVHSFVLFSNWNFTDRVFSPGQCTLFNNSLKIGHSLQILIVINLAQVPETKPLRNLRDAPSPFSCSTHTGCWQLLYCWHIISTQQIFELHWFAVFPPTFLEIVNVYEKCVSNRQITSSKINTLELPCLAKCFCSEGTPPLYFLEWTYYCWNLNYGWRAKTFQLNDVKHSIIAVFSPIA